MEARNRVEELGGRGSAESLFVRLETAVRNNPIGTGAVALGVGALVGLAIPLSKAENELLGDARDSLLESAQEVASEALDRAQRVAEEAKNVAVEKATEEGLIK